LFEDRLVLARLNNGLTVQGKDGFMRGMNQLLRIEKCMFNESPIRADKMTGIEGGTQEENFSA